MSEPSITKKVRKDTCEISSVDEERKSDCSRLSIEQKLADMKVEDDDLPIRRVKTFTEANSGNLLQKLRQQASALVSIENQKARSHTAGPLEMPRSHVSNARNCISSISTDNSNNSIASIDSEIRRSAGARLLPTIAELNEQKQRRQSEASKHSNSSSLESDKAQVYYGHHFQNPQPNPQLFNNSLLVPIATNTNFDNFSAPTNEPYGSRYDLPNSQINRAFSLPSCQLLPPGMNSNQFDMSSGKMLPPNHNHPIVLAALQNINANLMLISKVMKEGASVDDILRRPQFPSQFFGPDTGVNLLMDNRINLADMNGTPQAYNPILQMNSQPSFQQASSNGNQQSGEWGGQTNASFSVTNQNKLQEMKKF